MIDPWALVAASGAFSSGANLTTVLALGFGLVALAGAAAAVFRVNLSKSTIDLLKENNEAQEKRIELLEADVVLKDALIKKQGAQIDALQTVKSAKEEIKALSAHLDTKHQELMTAIRGGPR